MPHRLTALFLLCAALMACALPATAVGASATLYAYFDGSLSRLIDEKGRTVADEGWQHIEALRSPQGERSFVALRYDADGSQATLLDAAGQPLTDRRYEYIYAQDGELLAMRDGLMGVLDWDGSEILPARYASIVPTGSGAYLTTTGNPGDGIADEIYLTDADGVSSYLGDNACCMGRFSEGLLVAQALTGKFGYLDTSGQWAIAPIYDQADEFQGGRAVVARGGLYGMIDAKGALVLPLRYDSIVVVDIFSGTAAERMGDAVGAIVTLSGGAATIYPSDTMIPSCSVSGVDYAYLPGYGLAVLASDEAREVYDARGRLLLRLKDDSMLIVLSSTRALAIPDDGSSARMMDLQSGETLALLDGACDAYTLSDGEGDWGICVGYGGGEGPDVLYGICDMDGAEILPARYDMIAQVDEGVYSVRCGQAFGLMRAGGEWILEPKQ